MNETTSTFTSSIEHLARAGKTYTANAYAARSAVSDLAVATFNLIMKRRQLAGSAIGGIRDTQEMLDFCGENRITADIELIRIQQINTGYERLLKSDVKYRFVMDMASLR